MLSAFEENELLDLMSDVELLLKYRNYSEASVRLQQVMEEHPDYLPAKEALQEVYRLTGQAKRAQDLEKEVRALSDQRAKTQLSPAAKEEYAKIERRQFAEKVDGLIRIIYQGQSLEETFETTATELLSLLKADRCLLVFAEDARHGQSDLECCAKDVDSCLDEGVTELLQVWFRENPRFDSPIVSQPAQRDPGLALFRHRLAQHQIHAMMAYPLIYKSSSLGWLVVQQCVPYYSWSEGDSTLFSVACGHLATAFENLRSFSELQDLAFKDGLTGLYNRHFLKERLGVELSNAQRLQYPLSLAILDVDHFKRVNDTYGHPAGDAVLRKLGFLLKTNVRKGCVVARWGGEEFLVVFPNMEMDVGALIMERFREKVAQTIRVAEQVVTISAGLAQARWDSVSSLDEIQARLVEEADQNLYAAKRNGRNQVHWNPLTGANPSVNVPPTGVASASPTLQLPF
ncbi:MAG: sensor domain-containing diguanylate cyclase [Acidobacteria bacterium]|nr:sensor domain-containing diguanylate cyclase [Acidobacteriota bacterium]